MTNRWRSQKGLSILEMLLFTTVVNAGARVGLDYFKQAAQTITGAPAAPPGQMAPAAGGQTRTANNVPVDGLGVLSRTQTLALETETKPMSISIDEILALNALIKKLEPQGNFECLDKKGLSENQIFASVFDLSNGREPMGNPVNGLMQNSPSNESSQGLHLSSPP